MKELKINIQKYNMKKLMLSTTLGMFYYSINNAADDPNQSKQENSENSSHKPPIQIVQPQSENSLQQSQQSQIQLLQPQVKNSCCGCCGKKGKETKNEEESQPGGENNTETQDMNQKKQENIS